MPAEGKAANLIERQVGRRDSQAAALALQADEALRRDEMPVAANQHLAVQFDHRARRFIMRAPGAVRGDGHREIVGMRRRDALLVDDNVDRQCFVAGRQPVGDSDGLAGRKREALDEIGKTVTAPHLRALQPSRLALRTPVRMPLGVKVERFLDIDEHRGCEQCTA